MQNAKVPPWPVYSQGVAAELSRLVADGDVYDYSGHGPVSELEQEFSRLHDGRYVVSFNSGTSALYAALCALNVGVADEVLVPNLTFLASASPALWLGAIPVFVDSSPGDPSIDPGAIERAITSRTRVVVVTHLFGSPVDVAAIAAVCARRGVRLLEDCSHAHASMVGEKHVGTFGDAAIYSIGAAKLVSGGHGGLLVTPHAGVRDVALLVGHFKPRTRTDVITAALRQYAEFALGGNLRLSPLAAILALDHLRSLDAISKVRCCNVAVVDRHLEGLLIPVRPPVPRFNRSYFDLVYMLPPDVPAGRREFLLEQLQAARVPATPPSTRPLNRVLRNISAGAADSDNTMIRRLHRLAVSAPSDDEVPNSTELHDRMISLPAGLLHRQEANTADALGGETARVLRHVFGRAR